MPTLLAQLLVLLVGAADLGVVLLGLPGTWLTIACAALVEWGTAERLFHPATLGAAVALAAVGEALEFLAGAGGARRAGASRTGAVGALVGGVLGAVAGTFLIPVPILGTIAGGALGAFALSTLAEHGKGRPLSEALGVGRAAGVGHTLGLVGKFGAGAGVWILLSLAVFVP